MTREILIEDALYSKDGSYDYMLKSDGSRKSLEPLNIDPIPGKLSAAVLERMRSAFIAEYAG